MDIDEDNGTIGFWVTIPTVTLPMGHDAYGHYAYSFAYGSRCLLNFIALKRKIGSQGFEEFNDSIT